MIKQPITINPVPAWVVAPIPVADLLTPDATMRDVVAQALEYKRAFGECSARLDAVREISKKY